MTSPNFQQTRQIGNKFIGLKITAQVDMLRKDIEEKLRLNDKDMDELIKETLADKNLIESIKKEVTEKVLMIKGEFIEKQINWCIREFVHSKIKDNLSESINEQIQLLMTNIISDFKQFSEPYISNGYANLKEISINKIESATESVIRNIAEEKIDLLKEKFIEFISEDENIKDVMKIIIGKMKTSYDYD